MAYKYNIPQATDQLSISQGDLLGNFTALGAIAGNGSVPNTFSLNSTVGFNFVNFANQGVDPSTGAGQIALYAKTVGGNIDLFLRNQSNGTVVDLSLGSQSLNMGNGWQKFSSGLILQWGEFDTVINGQNTFSYPIAFPTVCLQNVVGDVNQLTVDVNTFVRLVTANANNAPTTMFKVWGSQRTTTAPLVGNAQFTFFAIGY